MPSFLVFGFILLACICFRSYSQALDCRYLNLNNLLVHPLDECMSRIDFSGGLSNPPTRSIKYVCNPANDAILEQVYDDPYCSTLTSTAPYDELSTFTFNCSSSKTCNYAELQYWILSQCDDFETVTGGNAGGGTMKIVVGDYCSSADDIKSFDATCDSTSVTDSVYSDNECTDISNPDTSFTWQHQQCSPWPYSTTQYIYSEISYCGLIDSAPPIYSDYLNTLDCRYAWFPDFYWATPLETCFNADGNPNKSWSMTCNENNDGVIKQSYNAAHCNGNYQTETLNISTFNCVSTNICPMAKVTYWSWSGECSDGTYGVTENYIAFVLGPNGDECFSDGNIGSKITCNDSKVSIATYNDYKCNEIVLDNVRSYDFLDNQCSEISWTKNILFSDVTQCDVITSDVTPTTTTTAIATTTTAMTTTTTAMTTTTNLDPDISLSATTFVVRTLMVTFFALFYV